MILVIGGAFRERKHMQHRSVRRGTVLADFRDRIRAVLDRRRSGSVTRQILVNPPAVITLDEVGCGIVPMEKSERTTARPWAMPDRC